MTTIFSLIAAALIIYTILCFVDIILTWIPGAKYTKFGQFISRITEPYLRIFSRLRWTHVGYVDFSPIISLGILSLASSIFGSIASNGRLSLGYALAQVVNQIWGICSSLIGLIFILVLIRFIVVLVKNNENDPYSVWGQLDNFLRPVCQVIAKPFYKNPNSYKYCLLTALIVLAVISILGGILCNFLMKLLISMPV